VADARVAVIGRGSLSVTPTPSPKSAEVYMVGRGILILNSQRTGEAKLITPNDPADPTRDYFIDRAELLAYPTDGLIEGDWAVILRDDDLSQVVHGARWDGADWVFGEGFEQGIDSRGGDAAQNHLETTQEQGSRDVEIRAFIDQGDTVGKIQWDRPNLSPGDPVLSLLNLIPWSDSSWVGTDPVMLSIGVDADGGSFLYFTDSTGAITDLLAGGGGGVAETDAFFLAGAL
jgi:hypothetical protein